MSRGVNKVILVGNAGGDCELRTSGSGNSVANVGIATTERWKDRDGNPQERTEWHRVKFFGKLAEIAGEYIKRGQQVYIEGSLRTEKYTDKDGIERYSTDVICSEMQLLGGPRERNDEDRPPRSGNQAGQRSAGGGGGRGYGGGGDGGGNYGGGGGGGGRGPGAAPSSRGQYNGRGSDDRNDEPVDDDIPFTFKGTTW